MSGPRRQIVIAGAMGSGKTTLGRRLATALGMPLSDSDDELVASQGETARELQAQRGRAALHALEAASLLRALARPEPQVICAAASTADDDRCLAALAASHATVILLRASQPLRAQRMQTGHHRPPVAETDADESSRRERRLASLHPHVICIEGLAPEEVASRALAVIAGDA